MTIPQRRNSVALNISNSQYATITRIYEQTRDHNRHLLENRREEVYRTVPGYRELDDSVSELSVSAAKLMLNGDDKALDQLKTQLSQIAVQKTLLLTDAGFQADYLEPIYTCPDCKDTGYVTGSDGSMEKCRCFRLQEISIRYAQSNIQEMIQRENFSTLSYKFYQGKDLQHFKAAVDRSKDFVKNFRGDYHNLLLYGTVGTGKSFLSGCVARELLQEGFSVIYFSALELFDRLSLYTFDTKSKNELQAFYTDLYDCDLLIIDDLGAENTNSFITSQLFACLNERELRRKPIIISTNLGLEELQARYSDRIFSRITGNSFLCKLTGPDIRIYRKRLANTAAHGADIDT